MAHLCGVCIGTSPSWDGHDKNPPCQGYEDFLLWQSLFNSRLNAYVIPEEMSDDDRLRVSRAVADPANYPKRRSALMS